MVSFKLKSLTMRIFSSTDSYWLGILCLRAEVRHGIFSTVSKRARERWCARVWVNASKVHGEPQLFLCSAEGDGEVWSKRSVASPQVPFKYTHIHVSFHPSPWKPSCQGQCWSVCSVWTWPGFCLQEKFQNEISTWMWCPKHLTFLASCTNTSILSIILIHSQGMQIIQKCTKTCLLVVVLSQLINWTPIWLCVLCTFRDVLIKLGFRLDSKIATLNFKPTKYS